MSSPENPSLEEDLAKLEETCRTASQAITNARSVREAIEAAEVEVPHHLQAIARGRVPSLGRLARVRDLRVEDIVKDQLASLQIERSDFVAIRELDRWKATDWNFLRSGYPDLYGKALREANLIIARKRKPLR
jgi:hypothetical protein